MPPINDQSGAGTIGSELPVARPELRTPLQTLVVGQRLRSFPERPESPIAHPHPSAALGTGRVRSGSLGSALRLCGGSIPPCCGSIPSCCDPTCWGTVEASAWRAEALGRGGGPAGAGADI